MKRMKRLISVILAAAIVIMLMPGNLTNLKVEAKATVVDSGKCGANVSWQFDSDGVLTISGTGPMTNYTAANEAPWREKYADGDYFYDRGSYQLVHYNYVKSI